jgi:hypothetical protein
VAEKKAYPLRISAEVLDALQRWSNDELRSMNAQIEYVLRDALRKAGRIPKQADLKQADLKQADLKQDDPKQDKDKKESK